MAKRKIYRFTGKEGTFLPEELMKKWMQKHLDHHETRGHFYGKEFLTKILSQPGCMGIRFYHAINDEGEKTLVVVGADAKGASMWASTHGAKSKGKLRDDPQGRVIRVNLVHLIVDERSIHLKWISKPLTQLRTFSCGRI